MRKFRAGRGASNSIWRRIRVVSIAG
jgi:hypothetical protein